MRYKLKKHLHSYLQNKASYATSATPAALMILFNYSTFNEFYKFIKKSQYWSEKQIEEYQFKKLNELLNHAYENVPYYRKLFNSKDLKPEDIHSLKDLQKIPFLNKEIIRRNIKELKAKNYPEHKFSYMTTGGSTGIPLGIYEEKAISFIKELAFFKIILNQVNCNLTSKSIIIKEGLISQSDRGKIWEKSLFGRNLTLSSFNLSEKNLPKYIKIIRKFKPSYILSYPSSIIMIAQQIKNKNLKGFKSLKSILCTGENLYDWQHELLEDVFNCRVIYIYGHTEQVAFASSCGYNNYYHFFPQNGITELVDGYGKAVGKDGGMGEIVGTGFRNFLFPLIRYKTGDVGIYNSEKCQCGRNYFILKNIQGRSQDFIVTSDDRIIPIAAINIHANILENVKQFQFHQEDKNNLFLKIVKGDSYSQNDSDKIKRRIEEKIGKDTKLSIEFVEKIPRTERGKHQYLIQKIPIKEKILKR